MMPELVERPGSPIFVPCDVCGGSAEELVYTRTDWNDGPQYDAKPCGGCDGFGTMEIMGVEITLEDLGVVS